VNFYTIFSKWNDIRYFIRCRRDRDHMEVRFTTTYAISAYHN